MPTRLSNGEGARPPTVPPYAGPTGRGRAKNDGKERLSDTNAMASGLAGRYASALFDLAAERGALDKVESDLDALQEAVAASPELQRMLKSPVVSREEHERTMASLGDRLGLGEVTRNFLGLLAQKRRLGALPGIVSQLKAMLAARRGEETAEVVSAVPLGQAEIDRLKESVGRYAGRAVNLTTRVDPGLLGGLVVRVGSRMVDASLKTKLQQLELSMRGVR
jgi:F-type H+-transporting ATPase subunit delta